MERRMALAALDSTYATVNRQQRRPDARSGEGTPGPYYEGEGTPGPSGPLQPHEMFDPLATR